MKIMRAVALISFSISLFGSGLPVFDGAGYTAKFISIYKQIEQLNLMKARIDYEVGAAQRMYKNLGNLDVSSMQNIVRQIKTFRARSRSIGFSYNSIADDFNKLYGKKTGDFSKKYQAWQKQSDESIKDAMISQGLLDQSERHMVDLEKILSEKRKGQSNADALQALGEINAIQSKQLADLSQIVASDARAKQSVMMENRSKGQQIQAYKKHLMSDFNERKSSQPLAYFPSLGKKAPTLSR